MDIVKVREYCLTKSGVEEAFPFDENTLVFKVGGKMFLLTDIYSKPLSFNVKCEPELALQLREKHPCVKPGYHMNKAHWNTITADGSVAIRQLFQWIDHSYDLIVYSLPKKIRIQIQSHEPE